MFSSFLFFFISFIRNWNISRVLCCWVDIWHRLIYILLIKTSNTIFDSFICKTVVGNSLIFCFCAISFCHRIVLPRPESKENLLRPPSPGSDNRCLQSAPSIWFFSFFFGAHFFIFVSHKHITSFLLCGYKDKIPPIFLSNVQEMLNVICIKHLFILLFFFFFLW